MWELVSHQSLILKHSIQRKGWNGNRLSVSRSIIERHHGASGPSLMTARRHLLVFYSLQSTDCGQIGSVVMNPHPVRDSLVLCAPRKTDELTPKKVPFNYPDLLAYAPLNTISGYLSRSGWDLIYPEAFPCLKWPVREPK